MESEEICVIKETWVIPMENATESGSAILERYFTKYPSNLEKFTFFMNIPMSELVHSPRFKSHANRIMRVFDDSIQALGHDWANSKLEEIWSKIATSHFNRQIEKQAFNELKEVILEVLTAACKLDEQQAATWTKLMDVIYGIVFSTLDTLKDQGQ